MKKFILALAFIFSYFSGMVAYDVVVAKDGSGDYTTVQEAIMSIRDYVPEHKTIFIKNGHISETNHKIYCKILSSWFPHKVTYMTIT